MRKDVLLFGIVLLAASFFRIYNLSTIPPHPSLDEVSIGYNAYSILKTGADEFGNAFPILLRAYDDYRPAHYTYLVAPFIFLFDLSVLAVRLPSVLLSIATVISVYFLVIEFLIKSNHRKVYALITCGLFAISPWHIYISRLGHEVNLFVSTFIFGVTFFFLYLRLKKGYLLLLASLMLALSFSAYQSGKIFIPIIIASLSLLYYRQLLKRKLIFILSVLLFVSISAPVLLESAKPYALVRFQATNIYSLKEPYLRDSAQKVLEAKENNDLLGQLLNNRRLVYILLPIEAYVSHFNPFWLFANGGDEPFKASGLGLLHIVELPFMLLGLYYFFKRKEANLKVKIFIAIWFFSSILPAAITTGFPHAMRIYQMLPMPQLFGAFGLAFLIKKFNKAILPIVILLAMVGVWSLYKSYFIEFPRKNAHQFQYGVSNAMQYAIANEGKYRMIYVSNKQNLFQSYMFYLFNAHLDPQAYQMSGGTISGGFAAGHTIGKFRFGDIGETDENSLIIANPHEVKEGRRIHTVYFPNGREAIWIVEK